MTSNPQKRNRVILMIHLSKKRTNPLAHLLVVIDREDNINKIRSTEKIYTIPLAHLLVRIDREDNINKMQYTRKMPSNTELKLAVNVTKTIFICKCIIMLGLS